MSRDPFRFLPRAERESLNATHAPRDCFADEVAIDFPAVDQFVSRVRDRFLGGREGETITAEVSVSRREASRGTVVPLDVTLRGTCPCCGGRGETWAEPCTACRGTGDAPLRHPVRVSVPAGVEDGARLRIRVRAPMAAPLSVEVRVAVRPSAA